MNNGPVTRPSLLVRLRDSRDEQAWQQFVDLYGPLIYRFARKRGWQDADAADLTQVVMQAVSSAIHRLDYAPERGTFRSWLFTIVRHQMSKLRDKQRHSPQASGHSDVQRLLEEQPARDDEALWEAEYQRQRFLWAAEKVRDRFEESTWQAFWQTVREGKSISDTAAALNMSLGAIYTARSRVLDQIKKEIQLVRDS